jgi:hypothetical protein
MSEISLSFLDGQNEKVMTFNRDSKIGDVLKQYLKEIDSYVTLDINIYTFAYGITILNKETNVNQTINDLGLDDDAQIKLIRKKQRNYALDKYYY